MKLIDKDALVAKIEELLSPIKYRIERDKNDPWDSDVKVLEFSKRLLSFLDILEAKEVDLEKIFNDEYSKFSNDTDAIDYAFPIDLADYREFAKHFFELGMAVNNNAQKGE